MTIRIGTLDDARASRIPYMLDGSLLSHKSTLMGAEPGSAVPNAFLIEQEPNRALPVHFHGYGQFQIVVKGGGVMGKTPLSPVTVHYAGQRTAYGPIVPGSDGLWYMTLRPRTDLGAYFMPESRHLRSREIPTVHAISQPVAVAGPGAGSATVSETIEVIAPRASGLATWLLKVRPGESLPAPACPASGGRFHVVVGVAILHAGRQLGWLSTLWTDPHDADPTWHAGPDGATALVLQFPADACRFPALSAPARWKEGHAFSS